MDELGDMKKIVIEGDLDPTYSIEDVCLCGEQVARISIKFDADLDKDVLRDLFKQLEPLHRWTHTFPDKEKDDPYDYYWRLTLEPLKRKERK